jgi:polar amino acid transport system substrate-binding protein
MDYALFTRKEADFLGGLDQLRGRRVLVQEATFIHEHLLEKGQGALIRPVLTEREALIRLAQGEGDAAVVTQLGGNALLRQHGLTALQSKVLPLQDLDYCFAILRTRTDLTSLGTLARLDRGLARLRASGEYDLIYRRWFGAAPKQGLARSLRETAWLTLPLLILLGLVLLWSAHLRRRVGALTRDLQARQVGQDEVKRPSGLLPVCPSCRRVRDHQGHWTQLEQFLASHSEAHLTPSPCPDCARLRPDGGFGAPPSSLP